MKNDNWKMENKAQQRAYPQISDIGRKPLSNISPKANIRYTKYVLRTTLLRVCETQMKNGN